MEVTMTTLTIALPADHLAKLQEMAARLHGTPEPRAATSIEELLAQPKETFQQALDYVLKKRLNWINA